MTKGQVVKLADGTMVKLVMDCTKPRFEGDKAIGWAVMPLNAKPGQVGFIVTLDELENSETV